MGALEQGLALAATPAVAAAAQTAGGQPAAPAAPAADPVLTPAGALGQAVKLMSGAREAVAQDPMQAAGAAALQEDKAARDKAAEQVQANMDQMTKLNAEPDDPRPVVPRLAPLPGAPASEHRDPLRVFGQFLPVLAALGALTTRQPAINALNAATAMVNAEKANDKEEAAKQRQAWTDNLNQTVQNNQELMTQYKLALDDHSASITERMAKINGIAALNRDAVTLATLKSGNLNAFTNYVAVQTAATGQLANLAEHLTAQQLEQKRLDNQQVYQWAELAIQQQKAGQVSMGDTIGPILAKIEKAGPEAGKGLDQVLSPGEIQALKLYMDINGNRQFANQPGTQPAAGVGGLPGMGAPAAAPGAPAPAVTAAAPAPAAGIKPAPMNPKDRAVGQVYATPRGGNLKWLGNGWGPAT